MVVVVLAVGAWQLRSVRRNPDPDPHRNISRFASGVVARVALLAAVYFGGYAVGFHHGRYDCQGYYVSPHLAAQYPDRIPGGAGCYSYHPQP